MTEPGKTPSFKPLSGDLLKVSPREDKLSMNFYKQGTLKRAHLKVLRDGYPAPFDKIVIGELDELGSEAGIRVAEPGEAEAMEISKSQTDNTAKFSMARLVTKYPALKVPRGRVRLFPISKRVIDGKTCLVLDLINTEVEMAKSRGKAATKKEEHPQSPGDVAASEYEENQ